MGCINRVMTIISVILGVLCVWVCIQVGDWFWAGVCVGLLLVSGLAHWEHGVNDERF